MTHETDAVLAEFFDGCAARGLMLECDADERRRLGRVLERWRLAPGMRVVEPGCGAGRFTEHIARAVHPGGEVFACDLSPEMLRRAGERGVGEGATFRRCSICETGLPDAWADKALCLNVFPHFLDAPRALAELRRLVKPGGELWINHLDSREALNARHREAGGPVISHRIPPDATLRRLTDAAGFATREISDSSAWGFSLRAEAV